MSLSDSEDPIWEKFRHKSITDLPEKLKIYYRNLEASDVFQLKKRAESNDYPKEARNVMKLMRGKDGLDKAMKVYKTHSLVIDLLFKDMSCRNGIDFLLLEIAELEAQMITGYSVDLNTSNVKEVSMKTIFSNVQKWVGKQEVQLYDKLRLILLWFVTFGGSTTKVMADNLFKCCKPELPQEMKRLIAQLHKLAVPINSKSQTSEEKKQREVERARVHKRAYQLENKNDQRLRKTETELRDILYRHSDGTLDSVNEYIWLDPLGKGLMPLEFRTEGGDAPVWYGNENAGAETKKTKGHGRNVSIGTSLRTRRMPGLSKRLAMPVKESGRPGGAESKRADIADTPEDEHKKLQGGRIIVLMLGGATFAETKDAYEMMNKTGREVIMCTTGMLTPLMFTESLKKMQPYEPKFEEGDTVRIGSGGKVFTIKRVIREERSYILKDGSKHHEDVLEEVEGED